MLVQINLKTNLNEEYADRGVVFSTEESTEEGINRIFRAVTIPNHEFWKKHFPNGAKETRIMYAMEDKRPGVYWGWNFDNTIKDYFDCELLNRFPQFDISTGITYTDEEFIESITSDYNLLVSGKPKPKFGNIVSSYGVADTVEQVLEYFKNVIDHPDNSIVISVAPIKKSDQSEHGGWRWHKWGQYIGKHTPKHEYLADEEDIEEVLIFHVHVLKLKD